MEPRITFEGCTQKHDEIRALLNYLLDDPYHARHKLKVLSEAVDEVLDTYQNQTMRLIDELKQKSI